MTLSELIGRLMVHVAAGGGDRIVQLFDPRTGESDDVRGLWLSDDHTIVTIHSATEELGVTSGCDCDQDGYLDPAYHASDCAWRRAQTP